MVARDPIITIYFLLLYLPRYHGDAGRLRVSICITGRVFRSNTVCHTLVGRKWIIWRDGGVYSWLLHLLTLLDRFL